MRAGAILSALLLLGTAAASAETVAIVGGTVYTVGPAGKIEGGTILLEDGKVRAVGRDVAVPDGARQIDAKGKVVTPGFMDSLTRLGLVEVSQVEGTNDTRPNEDDRFTAAFDVVDGINPRSILFPITRIEGVTRAVVAPQTGESLIAGQGAVIHLGTERSDWLLRSPVAMYAVLGESGAGLAGGARGAAMLRLREALQDALDYGSNRTAFDRGDRREYALSRLDLEALQPVVKGELPLVITVNRASDIEAALRLARDFRLKLIVAGGREAWMVARQLVDAKVPVLLDPMANLPDSFETLGATLESAGRLHKAGVTVAFMTGDSHDVRNIKQAAGNAVSYGMPWDAALAALTLVPARLWGIADRYGTLEPGKDADVVVWDGDPLETTSYPEHVFIRGVEVPRDTRQIRLRERYKDLSGVGELPYRQ
ncbi:MAG TPA: amidohydrolase family protein [Thermoanaerobaculia bacterium]|nr:amidohydrolase family protein [Thermoanaerobaculia bacterium]